ncbi:hypothetical protein PIROE2DRAFT_15988, partial [Piromyces sp. E2]
MKKIHILLKVSLSLLSSLSQIKNINCQKYYTDQYDVIDDDSELFTRECRFAMTDNLYTMKSCLEYLEGNTVTENELNELCDSFQDYYAKEGNDDDDDDDNDDDDNDKDMNDLFFVETEPGNQSIKNIPIMNMSNITKEEAEILFEVTKVFNDFDKKKDTKKNKKHETKKENNRSDKNEDSVPNTTSSHKENKSSHLKSRNSNSHRKMCHIQVKRWKEKCLDVSRIASIINTSLEIFYFRRESHCIRNQQNRYCTIVMNEIHQKAFNNSNSLVVPLNEQDRNSICECYKEHMTYLRDEYNSSIDPSVEKKYKPYSKDRKQIPKSSSQVSSNIQKSPSNQKRKWEEKIEENGKIENQEDQYSDPSHTSIINKIKYEPFSTILSSLLWGKNISILSKNTKNKNRPINDNRNNNHNDEINDDKKEKPTPDFLEELRRIFLRGLQPDLLEEELHEPYLKRMESDVNVQQLKKLIHHYHREMSQYMDINTCNITFTDYQSKNVMSSD